MAKMIRAGAISLLLLFFCVVAAVAATPYDKFSEPDEIGETKIPRFGNSRIALIIISADQRKAESIANNAFFANDLAANTFRNYWHENSLSSYDPKIVTFIVDPTGKDLPKDTVRQGPLWDKKWQPALVDLLNSLAAEGKFEPAAFDINGEDRMPDGRFDGMIVMLDNFHASDVIFPDMKDDRAVGAVKLGPTAIVGADASNFEILRAFARTLGFNLHDDLALSLIGKPVDVARNAGFPMLDGFNRIRAGWARRMDIKGGIREAFLLPSGASGEIYAVSGDKSKEYFILESRSGGGLYDADLHSPGIAIYHVDESRMNAAKSDVWHPVVMNVWPDGSYPMQTGDTRAPDTALFRKGDFISSDYTFQNPIGEKTHPLNTNWYSGEPSDLLIKDIDEKSHFPLISVVIGIE